MKTAIKAAGIGLAGLIALPTVALGASFTVSLIQGKTPAEAVQVIAEQLDALTGRVDTLEAQQAQTQAEVDALKAQSGDLQSEVDAIPVRGSETTNTGTAIKASAKIEAPKCVETQNPVYTKLQNDIVSLQNEIGSRQFTKTLPDSCYVQVTQYGPKSIKNSCLDQRVELDQERDAFDKESSNLRDQLADKQKELGNTAPVVCSN